MKWDHIYDKNPWKLNLNRLSRGNYVFIELSSKKIIVDFTFPVYQNILKWMKNFTFVVSTLVWSLKQLSLLSLENKEKSKLTNRIRWTNEHTKIYKKCSNSFLKWGHVKFSLQPMRIKIIKGADIHTKYIFNLTKHFACFISIMKLHRNNI